MAEWKKLLVSGSNIEVNQITGSAADFSGDVNITGTLSLGNIADVSASLAGALAGGDNLGNHTATQDLNLDGNSLTNILNASASGFVSASNFIGNGAELTNIDATKTEIQSSILSNQTVGGISSGESFAAGTDVEDLLRQILISFIRSTIGSLTLKNNGSNVSSATVREVNTSITADQFSISVSENDPNGLAPTNLSLTGSGATSGNFENDYSGTTLVDGTNTITISPDEVLNISSIATANSANITLTARAQDPTDSVILTTTRNYTYVYPFYYGATATDLSSATGTALETASLTKLTQTKGNKGVTLAATSQYLYFAYPSRYGDLASIKDGNNFDVTSGFTKYTVTINGGNGWSNVSYNLYRSTNTTSISSQTYTFSF